MRALIDDLERSGPEVVGAPVRGVVMLAQDVGELFPAQADAFSRRRRRAAAARLGRRALSLATAVHGLVADRPDAARAWVWNAREVRKRLDATQDSAEQRQPDECVRALALVARLSLALPALPDEEEWQAEMIAFADENVLAVLHEACLDLATSALRLAS